MPLRILIVQPEAAAAQSLARLLTARGDQVWQTGDMSKALSQLDQIHPQVVMLDLHFPGTGWMDLLRRLRRDYPEIRIIATNKVPDVQRELQAREQGVRVFLRQPFTPQWVNQALARLDGGAPAPHPIKKPAETQPRVRVPVRLKITLPYMVLALVFALVGSYLVSKFVLDSIQDRFNTQLAGSGKQSADWMVQEENRRLETLRIIANTQGVAEAIQTADAEKLRELVLPHFINSREEAVEILDPTGTSVLSLHRLSDQSLGQYQDSRGETVFASWDFVRYVLDRRIDNNEDKNSGLVRPSWGDYFYVSGPVLAPDGSLAGAVLVGRSVQTLAREMYQDTLATITFYTVGGQPLASSLSAPLSNLSPISQAEAASLFGNQDQASLSRDLTIQSNDYREILGPWEARGGNDLGILGTSLPRQFLASTNQLTRIQVFALVVVGMLLVLIVGIGLANQITRPLLRVVKASSEVARGNLEVKVDPSGNDEVAVLAHSFNSMVAGLQEGSIYRDLLGRTVSPEVREQLRQTFTSGNLRLEGQEAVATVMMSDIRGFTSLSEKAGPATIFHWLNEYFGELLPIITANNGVINKFDGDAMLAFFGILPEITTPEQSAFAACKTAIEILAAIERLNQLRIERGEPPLSSGIGINTGIVTAGGLGTSDRMHYTIIGDTVNTAQRLESLTRQLFNVSGAVISQATYQALGQHREYLQIDPLGAYTVKGKTEQLVVYRLLPQLETVETTRELAV